MSETPWLVLVVLVLVTHLAMHAGHGRWHRGRALHDRPRRERARRTDGAHRHDEHDRS